MPLWKKHSAPARYSSSLANGKASDSFRKVTTVADFNHIRPRVDTGRVGLGLKKSNSVARIREPFVPPPVQKRSEPSVLPSQQARNNSSGNGPFKVPDRPGGAFNRNSAQRQSLTRLFSRNGDKAKKASANDLKTPFGETAVNGGEPTASQDRRSQFIKKRSITSLSLFSGGGKKEEDHGGGGGGRPEPVKVRIVCHSLLEHEAFEISYSCPALFSFSAL